MTTEAQTAAAAVRAAQANLEQAHERAWARPARRTPRCAQRRRSSRRPISISRTRASPRRRAGLIANFELRPGSIVQSGVPIFTVIGDSEYWVDANFKETELRRDAAGPEGDDRGRHVPDHEFKGEVQSLSGGARTGVLAAARAERDRQLGQGDAARAGACAACRPGCRIIRCASAPRPRSTSQRRNRCAMFSSDSALLRRHGRRPARTAPGS